MMQNAWNCIEEVPYCFSRSSVKFQGHMGHKILNLDPHWVFLDCDSSLNSLMSLKWCIEMMHKAWCSIEEVHYYFSGTSIKFQGHTGWKIDDLIPIWVRLLGQSQLSNPSDLPCSRSSYNFQGHMAKKSLTLTQIGSFWTVTPVWIH